MLSWKKTFVSTKFKMILLRRRLSLWAIFLILWFIVNWYVIFTLRSSYTTCECVTIPCTNKATPRCRTTNNNTKDANVVRKKLAQSYQPAVLGAANLCPPQETLASSYVNMIGTFPKVKRYLTIAMSSVSRPGKSYIFQTLTSIIHQLSLKDREKVYIVVFLADLEQSLKSKLKAAIKNKLSRHLDDGIFHAIQAPYDFYPSFTELRQKYGDTPSRIKWRSKQNVDFSYLMCYCSSLSEYYLHLEDDVVPSPSFFPKLRDFISLQTQPWYVLSTAMYGHIGKVLHSKDLKSISSFYYLFYDEMPCDWLLLMWKQIKAPFLYAQRNSLVPSPGSLFQHFGSHSSLKEKTQNLTEPYFDEFSHKFNGLNPPALLTSNIAKHQGKPEDAYNKGIGYFWGKKVNKDDYIQIQFNSPVQLKRIVINTGSNVAPRDILVKGTLEASYKSSNDKRRYSLEISCSNFLHISNFETMLNLGLTSKRSVHCLRIRVREKQTAWLFLREINVWTW